MSQGTKQGLPPGPGPLSIMKLMFFMGRNDLLDLSRKFGDPMTLPTVMGRMVLAVSPEGIKQIFSADPETFVPTLGDGIGPILRNGLLFQRGAVHKRSRKLLTPPFHGARMRAYGNMMRETARRHAAEWKPGQPFTMIDVAQSLTLDVIIEAVFGVARSERVATFRKDTLDALGAFSPFIFIKAFQRELFGLGPWARILRNYSKVRDQVYALIAEYRRNLAGREDILSLLLSAKDEEGNGLSDPEIMDQLVTIVFAGHETTAIALAWAFYELHRNPEVLARLRAELDTLYAASGDAPDPEAIARLPFLEAVVNETLRLYPPVHILHRRLARPLTLLGWELPPGTVVAAGAYATHRLESIYPEPGKFKPERFLGRTFTPFDFLPWGGGARRCLGMPFAMYELKIVIATLIREYRLRLLDAGEVGFVHRTGTIGPKGGIRMALEA